MYFGYEMMWTFAFVSVGFALVMTVGIALAFVFAIGARWGQRAAARYAWVCSVVLVVGIAGDLAFAALSGEWARFVAAYGYGPVIELGLLAMMFIGSMWMMAASYVGSKR